ncbi:MAG TPA: hypothetical protein VEA19_01620, partial [Actinomycetota bacterium]|nr:hypothetical protein [Actinomycetota bacterium]
MVRPASLLLILVALVPSSSYAAAAETDVIRIPPARAGDAWSIEVEGLRFDLEAGEMGRAVDRRGREREALIVDIRGPHPVSLEGKEVTRHTLAVDAESGVAIADVAAWEFAGDSEPAAYSSFEPNNPDGWPGWVAGGGLLAGRPLEPGSTVEVPFVMTWSRGAERIVLDVEAAPPIDGAACASAGGSIHYPTWITWLDGGYVQRSLDVEVSMVVCEDSPYARTVELAFRSGTNEWGSRSERVDFRAGAGAAVAAADHVEPPRGIVSPGFATFGGKMPDGGALPLWSLDAAQKVAEGAPGLKAWRVANPDGYLVSASYRRPEDETGAMAGIGAAEWTLTFAAPSRSQHRVVAQRRLDVATAIDQPTIDPYP